MDFEVKYKKTDKERETYKLEVKEREGKFEVTVGDEKKVIDAIMIDADTVSMLVDGRSFTGSVVADKGKKTVYIGSAEYVLEEGVEEEYEVVETGTAKFEKLIKAPMPGSVVKINAEEGDIVKQGDLLIIVEAMKMENEMRAPVDLVVDRVHVEEKQQVDGMQVLMEVSEKD